MPLRVTVNGHPHLGVTVKRIMVRGAVRGIPSAYCGQCETFVRKCVHVTQNFDCKRYAPCDCVTHVSYRTGDDCIMVEYLAGGKPGRMYAAGEQGITEFRWTAGRPRVKCMHCGTTWLEAMQGSREGWDDVRRGS